MVRLRPGADVEIGAERSGDLRSEERAERLARDAPDQLAEQVALRDGVVARRRARLPPRRLRGEEAGALVVVPQVRLGDGLGPCGQPGRVRHEVADLDVVLAVGRELRPVNNSIYTRRDLAARLRASGLDVPEAAIWTSALATARFLEDKRPGGSAFVIGEAGLTTSLHTAGYTLTERNPDYVVLGETRTYSFERITRAIRLIDGGARFIATNRDRPARRWTAHSPRRARSRH